jgi:hypothetical protein
MTIPAVPVKGVWLRHEGSDVVVYIEREDGKRYEAIREHDQSAFSHHISGHGILAMHKLDHIQ